MDSLRNRRPLLFSPNRGRWVQARSAAAASLVFLACMAFAAAFPSELKISHRARALQPGEVVLISLESSRPLQQVTGAVFGKSFLFYPGRSRQVWQGLIGIDLDTKPGRYSLALQCTPLKGEPFEGSYALPVRDKKFPSRRLTVDEKYVTPPPEEEERIRRESRQVEQIFSSVTPRKIWQGSFTAPVEAPAGSSFGRRSILNGKPRSPHTGTDFSADAGTPIKAPGAGTVVLAAELYFSGNTVILDHGMGLYSLFAHLSRYSVQEGDAVKAGDTLGLVGSTGRATGPHLHWSIRLAATRVDPLSLIAALSTH